MSDYFLEEIRKGNVKLKALSKKLEKLVNKHREINEEAQKQLEISDKKIEALTQSKHKK